MPLSNEYDLLLAAAYVRGAVSAIPQHCEHLLRDQLYSLSEDELEMLLSIGRAAGLDLYHFKKSHASLPRVRAVLGFLHSIAFSSLLDVGSGRGAFLWPFMNAFPEAEVTSLDLLPGRVSFINTVTLGGVSRLHALQSNICDFSAKHQFDVVTLLEVLEHIPDVKAAVRNALQLAQRYVIVSVPSKADDNPEHIHLLTQEVLTQLFRDAGCINLHFSGVPGHLILIAKIESTKDYD